MKFWRSLFQQATTSSTILLSQLCTSSSFALSALPRVLFSTQTRIVASPRRHQHLSRLRYAVLGSSIVNRFSYGTALSGLKRNSYIFDVMKVSSSSVSFIDAGKAKQVDDVLMSQPGFSIDQLMELAGYSVACAAHEYFVNHVVNSPQRLVTTTPASTSPRILILAGPGNNGGDGLVAARHLKQFGYSPDVFYPKQGKTQLFTNLVRQCSDLDIAIMSGSPPAEAYISGAAGGGYDLIVDSMFGFSFQGPSREPFSGIIQQLSSSQVSVLSVDIPSGWNVDEGDVFNTGFTPAATISLTVPKLCMKSYKGKHYVGGRFVPPNVQSLLDLQLPNYGFGPAQIVEISDEFETLADSEQISVMFVTAGSIEEARRLSRALVERKLAACVNIIPQIESVYEWEGKIEQSQEYLLMIKTRKSMQTTVTSAVKELHSYDVPESIAVDISGGNKDYIDWVIGSTRQNSDSYCDSGMKAGRKETNDKI